jgi:hypothetical protein
MIYMNQLITQLENNTICVFRVLVFACYIYCCLFTSLCSELKWFM